MEDNNIHIAINGYMNQGYDSLNNNCSQVIAKGIMSGSNQKASLDYSPNAAYVQNNTLNYSKNTSIISIE